MHVIIPKFKQVYSFGTPSAFTPTSISKAELVKKVTKPNQIYATLVGTVQISTESPAYNIGKIPLGCVPLYASINGCSSLNGSTTYTVGVGSTLADGTSPYTYDESGEFIQGATTVVTNGGVVTGNGDIPTVITDENRCFVVLDTSGGSQPTEGFVKVKITYFCP